MKRILLIGLVATTLSVVLPVKAQLTVNQLNGTTLIPSSLVNTLLGINSGITFTNTMFIGDNVQGGNFSGGISSGLAFDDGIVMSSGDINNLPLPIGGTGLGISNDLFQLGDSMLNGIVLPQTTNDAAVLKFDFIPNGNQVEFRYIFSSTEYNGFVNTMFNDVFAFFVNNINYALVRSTIPVAINTVNCGGPINGPATQFNPSLNPSNCNLFKNNRTDSNETGSNFAIDHGGFTDVFSFVAPVNSNVTNTMYLAIADTADGILDSSVFLQEGSLRVCGGPGQFPCNSHQIPESSTVAGVILVGISFGIFGSQKQS